MLQILNGFSVYFAQKTQSRSTVDSRQVINLKVGSDLFDKRQIQFSGGNNPNEPSSKSGSRATSPSKLFVRVLAGANALSNLGVSSQPNTPNKPDTPSMSYDIEPYYQAGTDPFNYWQTPNAESPSYTPLGAGDSMNIAASASQNHYGFGNQPARYTYYTDALLTELKRPDVHSLSQAHSNLEAKGYQSAPGYRNQVPVSSFGVLIPEGTCNAVWEKNADPKPARFALLTGNGRDFTQNLKNMKEVLKNTFGLENNQIKIYRDVKTEDFDEGIKQLAQQVQEAQSQGLKPEVLVYHAGHGLLKDMERHHERSVTEGAAKGGVATANGFISEDEVKNLIRKNLPVPNTLLIVDACFSGSWTA